MIGLIKKVIRKVPFAKAGEYHDYENNSMRAYCCFAGKIEKLSPVENTNSNCLSKSIVQEPGFVEVEGEVYDLKSVGVYKFYRLSSYSEQRIVCPSKGDIDPILNMLGYLFQYGNLDQALPQQALLDNLTSKTLSTTCGNQAYIAQQIMSLFDIETRLVAGITLQEWNGYDDGHSLLEVKDARGQWFVYDPSFKCYFKDTTLYELSHSSTKLEKIEFLPGQLGCGGFRSNNFDYGFWVEERLLSKEALFEWYNRVLEVPLIYSDGRYNYPTSLVPFNDKSRISSKYNPLPDDDFSKFY